MHLKAVKKFTCSIELVTGLHIGAESAEMRIGGTDNPVIKNPTNNYPYIPGSSIKGKMRSLLEWYIGIVDETKGEPVSFNTLNLKSLDADKKEQVRDILKLFGSSQAGEAADDVMSEIGPSRLSFWDCPLKKDWIDQMNKKELPLTEIKMENTIDRITGVAQNPRSTERVPAGALFEFNLTVRCHAGDDDRLMEQVFKGLRLIELTGLGGSGSRGYGKVKFTDLKLDDECRQSEYDKIDFRGTQ